MRPEYFIDEIQDLLNKSIGKNSIIRGSMVAGLSELESVMGENFPVQVLKLEDSETYIWTNEFIYKCLWAFSTGNRTTMSPDENKWFDEFVEYQDKMSTSADIGFLPFGGCGCTEPDGRGISNVVKDFTTVLLEKCADAEPYHEFQDVLKTLDQLFMDMYHCVPINEDKQKTGALVDITNCLFDKVLDINTLTIKEQKEIADEYING